MKRWMTRLGPALLTVVVIAVANGLPGFTSAQAPAWTEGDAGSLEPFVFLTPGGPAEVYDILYTLSTQAAVLTGYLTLVEAEERPAQAGEAAELIHTMASQAAIIQGEEISLAETLHDLAEALDAYAAGDSAALAGVREASARNAELRETIRHRIGEMTDED